MALAPFALTGFRVQANQIAFIQAIDVPAVEHGIAESATHVLVFPDFLGLPPISRVRNLNHGAADAVPGGNEDAVAVQHDWLSRIDPVQCLIPLEVPQLLA